MTQNERKPYQHTSCNAINISFQVDVGNGDYVHLRVFNSLPHIGSHLELHAVKTGLTKDDGLQIFGKARC